jgi:hypothetical protein
VTPTSSPLAFLAGGALSTLSAGFHPCLQALGGITRVSSLLALPASSGAAVDAFWEAPFLALVCLIGAVGSLEIGYASSSSLSMFFLD